MEDKVRVFLDSGKLEEFVFGTLDPKDQREVRDFIEKYPAVNTEYQLLQNQLETIVKQQAIKAPIGMKSKILESLPQKNLSKTASKLSVIKVIAIVGVVSSLILAWAWKNSYNQLQKEKDNYAILASECEKREKMLESNHQLIAFLNADQTQRFEMLGNQLAPEFKATIFVNEDFGKAIFTPSESISLPKNQCLQLWGDLDGEMIPIAVLDDLDKKDYDLEINPRFTSLNLTIEEKTADGKGQIHPDVSKLIASVVI